MRGQLASWGVLGDPDDLDGDALKFIRYVDRILPGFGIYIEAQHQPVVAGSDACAPIPRAFPKGLGQGPLGPSEVIYVLGVFHCTKPTFSAARTSCMKWASVRSMPMLSGPPP